MTAGADTRLRARGRPGRPLDASVDQRILQATRDVVGEVGLARTTWARISSRSGSGYPTILRRWSTVGELVRDALQDLHRDVPVDTGSPVREALIEALRYDLATLAAGQERLFVRTLLFAAAGDAPLAEELHRVVIAPRRERYRRLLELGVERGELRPGPGLEAAVGVLRGVLVGAIVGRRPADPGYAEQAVTMVLDGVRAEDG